MTGASAAGAAAVSTCEGARVALAIGNRSYPDAEPVLMEPTGNARRVAQSLRQIGFETQVGEDLTRSQMQASLDQFAANVHPGSIAFLFFSGIGLQIGGHTYLLPIDAVIWAEPDVRTKGFSLDRIVATLEAKGAKLRVAVIDGARRNPFERRFRTTGSMGLAPINGASDALVMYSNGPGTVFEEAGGTTSPFVEDLAKNIETSGATAEDAFKRTRASVSRTSLSGQRPWISSSLSEDFFLDRRDCGREGATRRAAADVPKAAADVPKAAGKPAEPSPLSPPSDKAQVARATPDASVAPALSEAPKTKDTVETKDTVLQETALLEETRDRLFEQNFDPGDVGSPTMAGAIRKFEKQARLPEAGKPTDAVLQSLREADTLKPWGAIVFAIGAKRWGMSWGRSLRREALDEAKSRCGAGECTQAVSFWGRRCGAFALSSRSWTITWRNGSEMARNAALGDCAKGGQTCRLIGAVCADGSDRTH